MEGDTRLVAGVSVSLSITAGAEPGADLSSPLPLARGAGGGPGNTDAVPAAGCDGVRGVSCWWVGGWRWCAWGGMCAHVASSRVCLCFRCLLEVCARGWLLRSACLSGFRCACICVSVSEGSVHVCCLFGGCASTGSVLVAWELCLSSHAIGCVLWSVRACEFCLDSASVVLTGV